MADDQIVLPAMLLYSAGNMREYEKVNSLVCLLLLPVCRPFLEVGRVGVMNIEW